MSEHNVFTGLYWSNDTPHMSFFDKDEHEVNHDIKSGVYISIKITGQRYCIGYYDVDTEKRTPCESHEAMNDRDSSQCYNCWQHDVGSFIAKTGIVRTAQDAEFLQQDHVVYLALFGRYSTPKVGVARQQRYSDRIHEQGAWAAIEILQTDGNEARAVEKQISTKMHLHETMSIEKKLVQVSDRLEVETARATFTRVVKDIQHSLPSLAVEAGQFIFARPDFAITEHILGDSIHLIKSIDRDCRLNGQIVGVLGKVALIFCVDKLYALNTKLLEGYEIEAIFRKNGISEVVPRGIRTKKVLIDKQERLF